MNSIAKTLTTLLLAALPFLCPAQISKIPQRLEIVSVDLEVAGIEENLEVFNMPTDSLNNYYLSVGHLGIGDNVIQINFDPLFELFIPLGNTLDEALEYLQKLQELYNQPKGTSMEIEGCLAVGVPNEKLEKVKVTFQKVLFTKLLAFSIEREEYVRATHIPKSEFNSAVRGVKFYKKLHPGE